MNARSAGLLFAIALCLLPALAARNAAAQAHGEVADVPAGHGRVIGTLAHPDGPATAAGADVILYSVRADSAPGIRRTVADAEGRFAFEGISTDSDVTYLLGARYDGVPFVGRRIDFAAGQTEQQVDVPVAERTRDPRGVRVTETSLRIERIGSELVVNEVHRFTNPGGRVIFADPEERAAGATPAFRARLPAGFTRFALPYAVVPEGVVRDGRDVRFFGPLYPGEQELAFTWALPAPDRATELRLQLPSGADQLTVLVRPGVELTSASLSEPEDTEIQGVPYRMLQGGPLAAGSQVRLQLRVPAARTDPDALRVSHARTFLEADDAAVQVNEEIYLEVSGDAPVVGTPERPLLRVPLPPDGSDLRFGADFLHGTTSEDGHLVVRGPVPPGSSRIDLSYRLPVAQADGSARFVRRFAADVPVYSVYVADTGLAVHSPRLHRRRPVRTSGERTYLHFEAFRVASGETVEMSLVPLAALPSPHRGVRVAVVIGAALLAALFLAAPLLRRDTRLVSSIAPGESARREREALYESIRDLDHDFETGKISPDDHAQMRGDLRHRAVALLQAEREAEPQTPQASPHAAETQPARAKDTCPACHAPVGSEARFCAQCGRSLASDGAPA